MCYVHYALRQCILVSHTEMAPTCVVLLRYWPMVLNTSATPVYNAADLNSLRICVHVLDVFMHTTHSDLA